MQFKASYRRMKACNLISAATVFLLLMSCSSTQTTTNQRLANDNSKPAEVTTSVTADSIASPTVVNDSLGSPIETNMVLPEDGMISYMGDQAIIYKTVKDYSRNVPVTMNAEKTLILAYPAPKDIYYQGKLALPEKLKDGFWLDNRGVNVNSAFLELTYDEYSKLKEVPLLTELMDAIADKNPFTEIYSLGTRSRYKEEVKEINGIIERGALKKFKKIK
ncbi:hypothetical protein BH11BAC1_BH11BAC1_10880 [soil metagenome]